MTSSAFQRLKAPAQSPCRLYAHPETGNNIGFRHAISICRDSRERHSNDAVMLGNFGDDIGPQRVGSVIEDNDEFVAVSDFPNRPHTEGHTA